MLSRALDAVPVAVVDFETTGLHADRGDRIVEVAVVRADPGRDPRRFVSLVDPGEPVPSDAIAVHGITDEMLRGSPSFATVYPGLSALFEGAVIVAHNAPFDLGFLRAECARAGLVVPVDGPVVCTLSMARNLFALPRCNLSALAQRMGVTQPGVHRALADVYTTLGVFRAMVASLSADGCPTVGELLARVEAFRKDGPGRSEIATAIRAAAAAGATVTIDYTPRDVALNQEGGRLTTRRRITVTGFRPPYVEAFCHLRNEERVFRLDRIQRVVEG